MRYFSIFDSFSNQLIAAYTTRTGGVSGGLYESMNLCDYVGDDLHSVLENRSIFCNALGISPSLLFLPRQTHGDQIVEIDDSFLNLSSLGQQEALVGVDGLVTNIKNICIGVCTADCAAILVYDPSNQVIGIVHAGWRGTLAKIVVHLLDRMEQHFGSSSSDLLIAMAPCISQKNYEVGLDLFDTFQQTAFPIDKLFVKHSSTQKWHFDLRAANLWLLNQAGISNSQVEIINDCTFSQSDSLFSARKLGIRSGRIASCIMLK